MLARLVPVSSMVVIRASPQLIVALQWFSQSPLAEAIKPLHPTNSLGLGVGGWTVVLDTVAPAATGDDSASATAAPDAASPPAILVNSRIPFMVTPLTRSLPLCGRVCAPGPRVTDKSPKVKTSTDLLPFRADLRPD